MLSAEVQEQMAKDRRTLVEVTPLFLLFSFFFLLFFVLQGYLDRKRSREEDESVAAIAALPTAQGAERAPVTIDQVWADEHAARQVRGTKMQVESGRGEAEDEDEYQMRIKAEKIVSGRAV